MNPDSLLALIREGKRLLDEVGPAHEPTPCPGCSAPIPLTDPFCGGCGKRLRFPCPGCELTCLVTAAHCGACGVALTQETVGERIDELAQAAEEERRRRAEDLLRAYSKTRVLEEGRVRHLLGVRKDTGEEDFVKVASSGPGKRLLRNELAALEAIGEHPGVVRLREQRDQGDALVAVFEHVRSLPQRFPLSIPRLLEITSGVLATLEHVHARGIVHADLKPAHVLLPEGRGPVLIDWNVSQPPGPSRFEAFTPLFAAPEQIVGDHVDARADLYAVGVILYLLFTHDRFPAVLEEGSEPEPMIQLLNAKKAQNRAYLSEKTVFKGKLASLQQLQTGPAQQAAGGGSDGVEERRVLGAKFLFSSELRRTHHVNAEIRATGDVLRVVQRATAVDPDDRYPDAASMRAAIDAIVRGWEA